MRHATLKLPGARTSTVSRTCSTPLSICGCAIGAGSQPQPEERFEITGALKLNGGGYPEGEINYTTKGVLDRFAQFVPAMQLAMLRGAPNADGSFRNTLTIVDGQVKLLAVPFAQLLPLF